MSITVIQQTNKVAKLSAKTPLLAASCQQPRYKKQEHKPSNTMVHRTSRASSLTLAASVANIIYEERRPHGGDARRND